MGIKRRLYKQQFEINKQRQELNELEIQYTKLCIGVREYELKQWEAAETYQKVKLSEIEHTLILMNKRIDELTKQLQGVDSM